MGIPVCSGDTLAFCTLCQTPKSSLPYDCGLHATSVAGDVGWHMGIFLSVILEELCQSSGENAFSAYFPLH